MGFELNGQMFWSEKSVVKESLRSSNKQISFFYVRKEVISILIFDTSSMFMITLS